MSHFTKRNKAPRTNAQTQCSALKRIQYSAYNESTCVWIFKVESMSKERTEVKHKPLNDRILHNYRVYESVVIHKHENTWYKGRHPTSVQLIFWCFFNTPLQKYQIVSELFLYREEYESCTRVSTSCHFVAIVDTELSNSVWIKINSKTMQKIVLRRAQIVNNFFIIILNYLVISIYILSLIKVY